VVYSYHLEISEKVKLPLVAFQLQPALGGVEFGQETLLRLLNIRNVVAIKEASFNAKKFVDLVRVVKMARRDVVVLTGNDNIIYESLLLGAEGGLLGFGTIATDMQVEMFDLVAKDRLEEAREVWAKLLPLEEAIFAPPVRDYRARLKEALVVMGVLKTSCVRPPLRQISVKERGKIREAMKTLGLIG
ncbi:MAG: dihydrodipicolinate synthase family protein, partial [Candidatus Bathyarchaeia archaeon]